MRRGLIAAALIAVVAGGLAACGKKGPLEPPPQSRIEAPGEATPA
ncbi:MAG: lipoprotein [Alphaproteobacteria bacterium]